MDNTVNQIERHVIKRGRDKLYIVDDFLRYGDDGAVRVALSRLVKKDILIRVAHGIYAYPKIDIELGLGIIYPSTDRIARLIAKRDKARIIPTGAYALNVLGLSTQVPTNIVYHTDGAPRKINVYNHTILFKHTVPKNLAYKSEVVMLVVSAMKEIGNGQVTELELEIINKALKSESADVVEQDLQLAPAWIQKILLKQKR